MRACMYVQGMYVCTGYVCMYVCACVRACVHACVRACVCVCTMYVLCMYYVCMHVCMHACMYACMYVSIITWCLERYGHFDDVILNCQNLYHAYSIGGATHTLS